MIVLGISGLPNAARELAVRNPGRPAADRRICQGLDSAAALVVDGTTVAAAAEERFCGHKGCGDFPAGAIDYCLREASIDLQSVDVVAHGFDYAPYRALFERDGAYERVYSSKTVAHACRERFGIDIEERLVSVPHHMAHAASAFVPSGFEDALCVVADGMGEVHGISVLDATSAGYDPLWHYPISRSLGIFYSTFTKLLGYGFNADEYKVMGLAPYGDPTRYGDQLRALLQVDPLTGKIHLRWPASPTPDPFHDHRIAALAAHLDVAPRDPREPLAAMHQDLAAATQEVFEEAMLALLRHWTGRTRRQRLCLAGGCLLNSKANRRLLEQLDVEEVFIQPAAGDDGTALGAALYHAQRTTRCTPGFSPYLGPRWSREQVRQALRAEPGITWEDLGEGDAHVQHAARAIAEDRIIGWFHGRMEYGPRALGNRSILARPNGNDVKARINATVKLREGFRPFAPSVRAQDAAAIIEGTWSAPHRYMLATVGARADAIPAVASVVHVDGSLRVQVVEPDANPLYHALLTAVAELTGCGCVVNTSFNVRDQPLICDPRTAVETFRRTALDYLFIEGFKVWKT